MAFVDNALIKIELLIKGQKRLVDLGQQIRQVSFLVRDLGRQFAFLGAGLTAALAVITVEGAQFEQGLANVVSVLSELRTESELTQQTIEELSAFFLQLGRDTIFTASEITEAAEQLALAGFTAAEIQGSLEGIADLAAAAGESAAKTARVAANILRAFQLDAQDIERVGDTLTATFTNSNTTLESLGQSFKLVSPVASAFGQSIEDVATAIGILGNTGLSGTLAGTGLSRLLTQLASDTENIQELLGAIGSSADAVDPLRNSIGDIIAVFEELIISGKLTETQLTQTFDQRAVRALLNLVNQGSAAFKPLNAAIETSAGLTREVRDIRLDTVQGQVTLLRAAFSELFTTIFNTFSDDIRVVIDAIREVVINITAWVNRNQDLVRALAITAAVVASASFAVAGLATALGALLAVLGGFIPLAGIVSGIIAGIPTAITFALPLMAAFLASLAAIGAGFTALVFAVRSYLQSSGETSEAFEQISQTATETGEDLDAFTKELIQQIATLRRFTDLLGRAGTITEGELKRLITVMDELGASSSAAFETQLEAARIRQTELLQQVARFRSAIASGDLSKSELAEATRQLENFREQLEVTDRAIDQFEDQIDKVRIIELTPQIQAEGFETVLQEVNDRLAELQVEFQLQADSGASADALAAIQEQIDLGKELQQFLTGFSKESFEVFADAFDAGGIQEAFEAIRQFNDEQAKTRDNFDAIIKAGEEAKRNLDFVFRRIQRGLSEGIEGDLQELRDLEQRLAENTRDLIFAANARDTPEGDAEAAQALQDQFRALGQIEQRRARIIEDRNRQRDDQINDLRLARAKAEGDVATALSLLREERRLQLEDTIDDLFTLPAEAGQAAIAENERDRLDFIKEFNLETTKLADNLEEQLTKTEEAKDQAEELTQESSQRNELEKSVTQQLINQVKTVEQAALVNRLIRGEQNRRFREARNAARDLARAEDNLLESVRKRGDLQAKGLDTGPVDRLIRRQEKLVQVIRGDFALRLGDAEIGGVDDAAFQRDLEAAQAAANAAGNAVNANVQRLNRFPALLDALDEAFRNGPAQWVDALISGWQVEIPRFIEAIKQSFQGLVPGPVGLPQAVPAGAAPGANVAGPAIAARTVNDNRNITINVNGDGLDAAEVAEKVEERLAERFVV